MRLQSVSIENFKGLQAVTFEPSMFGCLVGENNAGKSSVLQAIVYGLNRPSQLPLSLFYDASLPVKFILTFSDVTVEHLNRLATEHRDKTFSLLTDGSLKLCVRYRPNEKVEVTALKLIPRDIRYKKDAIDACLASKRGGAILEALQADYPEFDADALDAVNIGSAKAFLTNAISRLPPQEFELGEVPLPSGIPTSISSLLPEAIYIPAVKNLADDLKTTQSTSFGRLLSLLLEDMTPDLARITESLHALNCFFNRTVENDQVIDSRHKKVVGLESLVESFLGENFPQARIELRIPPPDLKSILSSAQIFVDDGSKDLIDNKGDGIKRSLTFALLQAYVRLLSADVEQNVEFPVAHRPLLFLFEEPELYLHPKSQRVLFSTLSKIANTHQVVVTTHSPLFFAPGVTAAFVRIAKEEGIPKPIGKLYPVNFSLNQGC